MVLGALTRREIARKVFHISSVFTIFYDKFVSHKLVTFGWLFLAFLYLLAELIRRKGKEIPIITDIIEYCAYPEEKKGWILPPFLFSISMFIVLYFYPITAAYVAILAMSLGDGLAAIFGKLVGKRRIPYSQNKTLEGSFVCFLVTFLSSLFLLHPVELLLLPLLLL